MNINKLTLLFFLSCIYCQFYKVDVTLEYNQLDYNYHSKKNILENLDDKIKDYFLQNNFSPEYDFIEVELKVHMVVETIDAENNLIKSYLLISNNKDQYYFSKGLDFTYNKTQTLIFNPYSFEGIESILNYFAFLFIGYELDTWGYNLGNTYYNKSFEISSASNNSSFWNKKKGEIKKILDNLELREARFLYFSYFDLINSEEYLKNPKIYKEKLSELIVTFYNTIQQIYRKIGLDKDTLKFIEFNSDTLGELFYQQNMQDALEFLALFDDKNKEKYLNYINKLLLKETK